MVSDQQLVISSQQLAVTLAHLANHRLTFQYLYLRALDFQIVAAI